MPEYPGAGKIGFLLSGGAKQIRNQAFDEGRLNTAKTEAALANARESQMKATAGANAERAKDKFKTDYINTQSGKGKPPQQVAAEAEFIGNMLIAGTGGDYYSAVQGQGAQQHQDLIDTAVDPATDAETRTRALGGLYEQPYPDLVGVSGTSGYTDITKDEPTVTIPPGGGGGELSAHAKDLNFRKTLTDPQDLAQFDRLTNADSGEGTKAPANFMLNPTFDPTAPESGENKRVIPISGGPADPDTAGRLGTRERAMIGGVLNAAANTVGDIGSIMSLDPGVDVGFFGQGAMTPGSSLIDIVGGNLRRGLNEESSNNYNAILGNLSQQIARIEQMGYAVPQGLADKFDALTLVATDTVFNKMIKMSQMRQSVENAMETLISLNALPPKTEAQARKLAQDIRAVVPFTTRDVITLTKPENAEKSLGQIMQEAGGGKIPMTKQGVVVTPSDVRRGDQAAEAPAEPDQSIEEIVIANGDGVTDAQGQIVRQDGWILRHDPQGNYAWVNPEGTGFEPVAQ